MLGIWRHGKIFHKDLETEYAKATFAMSTSQNSYNKTPPYLYNNIRYRKDIHNLNLRHSGLSFRLYAFHINLFCSKNVSHIKYYVHVMGFPIPLNVFRVFCKLKAYLGSLNIWLHDSWYYLIACVFTFTCLLFPAIYIRDVNICSAKQEFHSFKIVVLKVTIWIESFLG